jgi:hypothetical protein
MDMRANIYTYQIDKTKRLFVVTRRDFCPLAGRLFSD